MNPQRITEEEERRVKAMGFLRNKGNDCFSARILTINGKITAAQNKCVSEASELFGNGIITFTSRLTIECQGIHYDKIKDFQDYIGKEGLVTGGTGPKVRPVVSCKGTTCQYGLIDTFALSEEIHERFYNGYAKVKLPHKFKIAVGGCPNNCVKPDLNDIGIIGQRIPHFEEEFCNGCKKCGVIKACPMHAAALEDGILNINHEICINCGRCVGACYFNSIPDGTTGYKIYIGGRWGKNVAKGIPLSKVFTSKEEALDVVEKLILLYKEQGHTGERLSQTMERMGFEVVEKELLSDDILARKQGILETK